MTSRDMQSKPLCASFSTGVGFQWRYVGGFQVAEIPCSRYISLWHRAFIFVKFDIPFCNGWPMYWACKSHMIPNGPGRANRLAHHQVAATDPFWSRGIDSL